MAFVHGKTTVVTVDGNDLSAPTNTSEFNRGRDTHDVTGYGNLGHRFRGGLTNGTFTMGGTYDDTAMTGPAAVLKPLLLADPVTVVRQPEGAGPGLPQESFSGVLQTYVQTAPSAGMITWRAEFVVDGAVDDTPQA